MENKDTLDIIMRLARVTRRSHPAKSKGHHHSRSVFRALVILREAGAMRASDLAERLDIRPASLTEQLMKMEQHGLIRREKDPADMRVTLVTLTEKGSLELDRSREERLAWSEKLQKALTEEEHQQFAELAEKLIAFFEAELPSAGKDVRGGYKKSGHGRPKSRSGDPL
ncbi:MAG: MarR family transcriptional regulator [Clostridiaceae bacterium]|nr:MarR family transcriptional regulator [Clostridiaceae bacterium]